MLGKKLLLGTALVAGLYGVLSAPAGKAGTCNGIPCVQPAGFCALASIASATGLASCSGGIPANSIGAMLVPYTASLNWRDDGTAPTTTAGTGGQTLASGSSLWYAGDLTKIQVISATGGVSVSFYK